MLNIEMSDIFHRVAPAKQTIPTATAETVNAQSGFAPNQTNINNTTPFVTGGGSATALINSDTSSNITNTQIFDVNVIGFAPIDPFLSTFGLPQSVYSPVNRITNSNGGSVASYYSDVGVGRLIICGLAGGPPPSPPFSLNATLPYLDFNPGVANGVSTCILSINSGYTTFPIEFTTSQLLASNANLLISSINGVAPPTLEQSQKQNITGFATILSGTNSVTVSTPVSSNSWGAVVTPSTNMGGGNYWVNPSSVSSFTINTASNVILPQMFFYSAVAL